MSVDKLLISRLSYLEQIDEIREKYSKKIKQSIPNVSGWDISKEYKELFLENFEYSKYFKNYDLLDYVYTYDINTHKRQTLIQKFGGNESNSILLVQNNTIALVNAINFIAHFCNEKIALLSPCYFSLPNLLNNRKLKYTTLPIIRSELGYKLPKDAISSSGYKVIILTNPVFSTGMYLDETEITFLANFLKNGNYIISDESLAAPKHELLRYLGSYPGFISVYSPHKFVHCNSFKFSCIVYNNAFEDFFDQWNDIYAGSLNITNLQAINHFLSDNYMHVQQKFLDFTNINRLKIIDMLNHFDNFETDMTGTGDFMCIYNKKLSYEIGNDIKFMKKVLNKTNSIFYPGCLHGFQKEHGFVFRVNLVSFNQIICASLLKILNFLSSISL